MVSCLYFPLFFFIFSVGFFRDKVSLYFPLFKEITVNYICICESLRIHIQKPEGGFRSSGAGIIGSCKLLDMPGTEVLSSQRAVALLITEPPLQPGLILFNIYYNTHLYYIYFPMCVKVKA